MVKSPQPHCLPPSVAKKSDNSVVPDLHNSVPHEYCPSRLPGQSLDGGSVEGSVGGIGPVVDVDRVVVSPDGVAVVGDSVVLEVSEEEPQPIVTAVKARRGNPNMEFVRIFFAGGNGVRSITCYNHHLSS